MTCLRGLVRVSVALISLHLTLRTMMDHKQGHRIARVIPYLPFQNEAEVFRSQTVP